MMLRILRRYLNSHLTENRRHLVKQNFSPKLARRLELRLALADGGERVQAQHRTQARLCDGPSVVCTSLSNGYGSVGRSCPVNEKSAGVRAGITRNEHVYGSDTLLRRPVR